MLAVGTTGTLFAANDDYADYDKKESSLSVKLVHATALKSLVNIALSANVDMDGLMFDYAAPLNLDPLEGSKVKFELVGSFSVLSGDEKVDQGNRGKATVSTLNALAGLNMKMNLDPRVTLWGGPRLGIHQLNVEYDFNDPLEDDFDKSKLGFLYGLEVGADIYFNKSHGLGLGLGYWVSDVSIKERDGFKTQEQSYLVFTLGYRYRF